MPEAKTETERASYFINDWTRNQGDILEEVGIHHGERHSLSEEEVTEIMRSLVFEYDLSVMLCRGDNGNYTLSIDKRQKPKGGPSYGGHFSQR